MPGDWRSTGRDECRTENDARQCAHLSGCEQRERLLSTRRQARLNQLRSALG